MSDGMPVDLSPAEMFTLLDRGTMRLQLPDLRVASMAEPLRIHLDLDVASVDDMLERLTVLRAQMLPAPTLN
jgi:hypothetical protein